MKTKKYRQLKNKLLKDKEIRQEYENLGPEFSLINLIIKERIKKGMSQKELAGKMGTKQSAISRFESGKYNPSLSFLQKIAEALDTKLKVSLK